MFDWARPLTAAEQTTVDAAAHKAHLLYEGVVTPHRSCGIAMAETFALGTRPYQALRKGGITGNDTCGVVVAGRLILGEILGDADPTGKVSDELREAVVWYESQVPGRIHQPGSLVCNDLTRPHGAFQGPTRARFCTDLTTEVARLVAEILVRMGRLDSVAPIEAVVP